jgi:hypothetical protein
MSRKFSLARFFGVAIFAIGEPFCLGLVGDPFWVLAPWVAVLALFSFATGWRLTTAAAPLKSFAVALAFMAVIVVPAYLVGQLTGWLVLAESPPGTTGGPEGFATMANPMRTLEASCIWQILSGTGFPNKLSMIHGWSAFGGADHGWEDVGLEEGSFLTKLIVSIRQHQ